MPESADVNDDESRIDLQQFFVVDAEFLQPDHVLHEDVGFPEKPVEDFLDFFVLEVELERHGQFVSRVLRPGRGNFLAVDGSERGHQTQRVADAGAFDVDDFGPEIGQYRGGKGHRDERAAVDDPHPRKGAEFRDDKRTIAHGQNPPSECYKSPDEARTQTFRLSSF